MSAKPGRLAVGIIGAGRVGAVLGSALRAVGHEVVGVSGGSPETLSRIETLLPAVPVLDMVDVARAADLVIVGVPDDAIADVVGWVAAQGGFRPGQIVLHPSGSHGTDVLAPAVAAGAIPLAVHPAMTFTGTSLDLARLEGTPFAVTAPAPVQPIGQALVVELGGEPVLLADAARPAYHAALCHAANHLVTLVSQAQTVLADASGEEPGTSPTEGAGRLLGPVTRAALEGALTRGPAALTGPVSRGDVGTVAAHLRALDALDAGGIADVEPGLGAAVDPADGRAGAGEIGGTYRAMALATTALAQRARRIDDAAATDLRRALAARPETVPAATTGARPAVVHTVAELRAARRGMVGDVAIVPTMGALHAGHLALVRAARQAARHVVVSVFVNPTQFGDAGDLAVYPRTLEADVAALAALGADAPDVVFAPSVQEMYPRGRTSITLDPGPIADRLEGASRPGHYSGVLTVVSKLFHLVQPDVAVFGEKDAQQLALVRLMVADLDVPLWVLSVPTVREADGLALSSRNARLSADGRERALALSRSVAAVTRLAAAGASPTDALAAARAELDVEGVEVDYAEIVDAVTFEPVTFEPVEPGEVGDADETGEPSATGGPGEVGTNAGPGAAEPRYVVAAVVEGVRLIDTGAVPFAARR